MPTLIQSANTLMYLKLVVYRHNVLFLNKASRDQNWAACIGKLIREKTNEDDTLMILRQI